jgi:hypothetical protein
MKYQSDIISTIKAHRSLFIIIIVGLFLIELEIFAVAAMKSGRKSMLQISDPKGNVVLLTEGASLSQIDKTAFERTFGALEHYSVHIFSEDRLFPFRAWFVAAVGIPVGMMLLFAFVIKAWTALFDEKQPNHAAEANEPEDASGLQQFMHVVSRFNIFIIGVLVFMAALAYWILPNFLLFAGKASIETIARYKWVALTAAVVFVGSVLWIIYLRYLLAKKTIESHKEMEKYRLQLQYKQNQPSQITYTDNHAAPEHQRDLID